MRSAVWFLYLKEDRVPKETLPGTEKSTADLSRAAISEARLPRARDTRNKDDISFSSGGRLEKEPFDFNAVRASDKDQDGTRLAGTGVSLNLARINREKCLLFRSKLKASLSGQLKACFLPETVRGERETLLR